MSEIKVFENEEFGKVRVTVVDGEPWFVASDVCKALAIKDTWNALSRLDDDEKGTGSISTLGGSQEMSTVNEPGLYSLILGSRKPEAKAFKRWITHDVIPSIRKHGAYIEGQEQMDDLSLIAKALIAANSVLEERAKKIAEQTQQIASLEPDAMYCREVLSTPGLMLVTTIAKGFDMTATALNRYLSDKGVQFKRGGVWHLSKAYQGQDFARYDTVILERAGGNRCTEHLKWTQKGRKMIYDLLLQDGLING